MINGVELENARCDWGYQTAVRKRLDDTDINVRIGRSLAALQSLQHWFPPAVYSDIQQRCSVSPKKSWLLLPLQFDARPLFGWALQKVLCSIDPLYLPTSNCDWRPQSMTFWLTNVGIAPNNDGHWKPRKSETPIVDLLTRIRMSARSWPQFEIHSFEPGPNVSNDRDVKSKQSIQKSSTESGIQSDFNDRKLTRSFMSIRLSVGSDSTQWLQWDSDLDNQM
jgi:hypothetical protein